MIKSNKLPKKVVRNLNLFLPANSIKHGLDTDTTTITLSTVTSTHLFVK